MTSSALLSACAQAAAAARGNRMRTGLAALATAAAVATMVIVISGLDGVARYARETGARTFGTEAFVVAQVSSGQLSRKELAARLERNPPIRRADARFLQRVDGDLVIYAPTAQRNAQVVAGNRKFENASVNGTAATLPDIREIEIGAGRFFSRTEEGEAAQVAVIGADVAEALFPDGRILGRRVRLAGRAFDVVGVVTRQGQAGGVTLDRYVYIPLPAYERAFGATGTLQVFARGSIGVDTLRAEDRAHASMRARRQLAPGEADSFDIITPAAARTFVLQLAARIGVAALPISIMALIAAVVVVTNTVLVSVTERTRDIGIRRAVGAPRSQILAEVLAEALLTALLGGVAGVAIAAGALTAAAAAFDIPLAPSAGTIAAALLAAIGTGLSAGYFPARKAARLDIVAAMHAE
jgi:putative ABC transport system permease protein